MAPESSQITIGRIQDSMVSLEEQAHNLGISPVDYVRQKDMYQPSNKEEYLESMAEVGIESDIRSDDTLSWTFEIEAIEATLNHYPEQQQSLDHVTGAERDVLKQLMKRPPSNSHHDKSDKDNDIQFE